MNSMNPLREVPLLLTGYLPDTLFWQGFAMAVGIITTIALVGGLAALGVWLADKMGYLK